MGAGGRRRRRAAVHADGRARRTGGARRAPRPRLGAPRRRAAGLDLGAERLLSRRAAVPGPAALAGLPRRRSREHARRDRGAAARPRRPRRLVGALGGREAGTRVLRADRRRRAASPRTRSPTSATASTTTSVRRSTRAWSRSTFAEARGGISSTRRRARSGSTRSRSCRRLSVPELRIGLGVDAHAFEDDVRLVLGGVAIDHPRGLAGHSDGDVIAHALIDARARGRRARRHRLALPVRRRALARRRLAPPPPRRLRAGARSGLRARQRRLRADRRGAEDRAAPRGDAPPARKRARRRAATG